MGKKVLFVELFLSLKVSFQVFFVTRDAPKYQTILVPVCVFYERCV